MASGRPWCRHGRRCFSGMRTAATRSGSRRADASRPVDSGGDRQPDLCRVGARSHGDGRAVEVESRDARAGAPWLQPDGQPRARRSGPNCGTRRAGGVDPTVGGATAASRLGSDGRPDHERAVGGGESASGTEVRVEQLGCPRRSPTAGGRLEGAGGSTLRGRRGCCAGGVRAERGARGRSGRVWFARAVRRRRSGARAIGEPGAVAGGRFRADCVAGCPGFFGIEA
jgi:hypothetical protein